MRTTIADLMQSSGVKFGTSGARGLVSEMSDRVCYAYTAAFLQHLEQHHRSHPEMKVAVAGDLRSSTGRIQNAVLTAVIDRGYSPMLCGRIPSPAVALYGLRHRIPSIMITGSHIPDDRNGIKFNAPEGEILKDDEASVRMQQVELPDRFDNNGMMCSHVDVGEDDSAARDYVGRYTQAFSDRMLMGKHLGLYAHSAVGRDLMQEIYESLGARITRLADSDVFIPVDTEAIRPEDEALASNWAAEHGFDAIVSTDGDGDRPLLSDEHGRWLRGDVAGILCAKQLRADVVVTPVSSNSAVEMCGAFAKVVRTRIGSPYVIEAMEKALAEGASRVVGYEANGGFLTSSLTDGQKGQLDPLPTRDAVIVHLSILWAMSVTGRTVSQLVEQLPSRFTWSDRLQAFPTEVSQTRLRDLERGGLPMIEDVFRRFGSVAALDWTDGMRVTFSRGAVVHVRASGNAPELRCYSEGATELEAREWNEHAMRLLQTWRE